MPYALKKLSPIGFGSSLLIFGTAAIMMFAGTHYLIPWLSVTTGREPVIFWFIVAGLGIFLPLLITAAVILKSEGFAYDRDTWRERLRFRKMNSADWIWSLAGIVLTGITSGGIMLLLNMIGQPVDHQPPFMQFEPLTEGRYWILLLWFPYWLLNIMGEEILWRGVLLPRQELRFGRFTWLIHGGFWGIFHIAFGWQLLITLAPILIIQSYIVQRRQNSWTGVVIHAAVNGPSFLAISFGLI